MLENPMQNDFCSGPIQGSRRGDRYPLKLKSTLNPFFLRGSSMIRFSIVALI